MCVFGGGGGGVLGRHRIILKKMEQYVKGEFSVLQVCIFSPSKKKKKKSAFSLKNKYLFIYLKSLFLEDILKSLHVPFPKNKIK